MGEPRQGEATFPLWDEMEAYALLPIAKRTRVAERRLIKAAIEWLPYSLYRQGGTCLADAPYGNYWFVFVVEMEQERLWQFPEFQAGYQAGFAPYIEGVNDRDANPYAERARARSWDRGFILGMYEGREQTSTAAPTPLKQTEGK